MQQLNQLIQEASSLAMPSAHVSEVHRVLQICNACRYCEGFCATFASMTRRLEFTPKDIHFMANLCHNCGACLHACQYAPPNEFGVNIPQAMAKVRLETYTNFAWPRPLGVLYEKNGLALTMSVSVGIGLFFLALLQVNQGLLNTNTDGNFYAIFPHNALALVFGIVFLGAIFAMVISSIKFWQTIASDPATLQAGSDALHDALTLKNLGGGHQAGCNEADDAFSLLRKRFHHLTFYGFMLCFASTSVATLYHYLFGWQAPYGYTSLPVVLGTLGGIGLVIGPVGLLYLNMKRHPLHGDKNQKPMDIGFITSLLSISITGLALLAWRETSYMGILLALHLGFVMGFFLMMPYGKFAHGIYRSLALLQNAIEVRQGKSVRVG
ncbi:MAG: tricarballylate utilization 4Fe-4S protein TcuB, partial [Polynucleobacter sp.]|nr:tricarballylate utilization 4Fe-4S protein TcuB [Polynucleobacter sp.]